MRRLVLLLGAMAATACSERGALLKASAPSDWVGRDTFKLYADRIEEALGTFNDIRVFEKRDNGTWRLVSGWYVPVTLGGHRPEYYSHDMDSDRPMMLPTIVQDSAKNYAGGDGQSNPCEGEEK